MSKPQKTSIPDQAEIYRSQAEQYEALVSREDYQGNLLPAIRSIFDPAGKDVVEFGAGTGRLTCQLAQLVQSIRAYDQSDHMLEVAREKLSHSGLVNWTTSVADHRHVPESDHSADLILSGWSVCYLVVDNPNDWRTEIEKVLFDMKRILREDGSILLIETLGTGFETPTAPEHLVEYYAWLESHCFHRQWIRTDYRFETMDIAQSLTSFFFGNTMTTKLSRTKNGITLPECTGLWSRKG